MQIKAKKLLIFLYLDVAHLCDIFIEDCIFAVEDFYFHGDGYKCGLKISI